MIVILYHIIICRTSADNAIAVIAAAGWTSGICETGCTRRDLYMFWLVGISEGAAIVVGNPIGQVFRCVMPRALARKTVCEAGGPEMVGS